MEKTNTFESPQISQLIDKYSLILAEARRRALATLLVFVLAAIAGFVFYENIIRFLINVLAPGGINIVFTSPFQFINLAITCGFATGVVAIVPLIVLQVVSFLRPALRIKEYRLIVRCVPFSIVLFIVGFGFGAAIMKWQIDIFLSKATSLGIGNMLDISSLLSVVLLTSILMGVGFQFPIILLTLMRLGIITHNQLAKKRKWVYSITLIVTMFLPPDSILANIALSIPFILSFEVTLLVNRILDRGKK